MTNGPLRRSPKPLHLQARAVTASSGDIRKLARHFAKIANAPLTKQDTADAWNERQNRLAASRDAARLHLKASYKAGQEKKK